MKKKVFSSVELEIVRDRNTDDYCLAYQGRPLKLIGSKEEVRHDRRELLHHMRDELDVAGTVTTVDDEIIEPKMIGSYALMSLQKTWIENNSSNLETELPLTILHDCAHVYYHPPEEVERRPRMEPLRNYLLRNGTSLFTIDWSRMVVADQPILVKGLEDEKTEIAAMKAIPDHYVNALGKMYSALTLEEKTVATMLANRNKSVSWALTLVSGGCSPTEYVKGVSASHAANPIIAGDVTPEESHSIFKEVLQEVHACFDYLRLTESVVSGLVRQGEGKSIEFKSSLRWDVKEDRKNREMTREILRAIAALMNSDGGCLLVGVDDEGRAVGLEIDQFKSTDKALLFLKDNVKSWLGTHAAAVINTKIETFRGKSILLVECPKSSTPIYLRGKRDDEDFFVRLGPSSAKLDGVDLKDYLVRRFG